MNERLYLDSNATALLRPEVRASYLAALERVRGNPSSLHEPGRVARHMLDEARERIARALDVHEDELLFTSGGTESNNLAILGALRARGSAAGLAVTSIEHSSVLGPARALARAGHPLRVLEVDSTGTLLLTSLEAALSDPSTALVSTMAANNELGTCCPLEEVAAMLARGPRRPLWHVDAVQALGRVPLDLRKLGIDLASFSLHKLGAPVGVGLLYRRSGVTLEPLMYGGEQELGLRPGTENVAGAVAAATAVELALGELAQHRERLAALGALLWGELVSKLPHLKLLGLPVDHPRRLPGTLNILARELDGKVLVMRLDLAGVAASAGSACASGSLEPSHVLKAIGCSDEEARSGLRLSCGRETRAEDVHRLVDGLWKTLSSRT